MERCKFDLNYLLEGLEPTEDDFISAKFQSNFPERIPRFIHKYAPGKYVDLAEDPRSLDKFSVSIQPKEEKHVSFRDRIKVSTLEKQEANSSFWVHTNYENAYHYYTKTLIEYLKNHRGALERRSFPKAVVVGHTTEKIKQTCTDLCKGRSNDRRDRLGIKFLDPTNPRNIEKAQEDQRYRKCDLVIGTPTDVLEELKVLRENQKTVYKHHVSLIIVENCEAFIDDEEYLISVQKLLEGYHGKFMRVMFFCLSTSSKGIASIYLSCQSMVVGKLVVEVEGLREREMFDYIKIHQVTDSEEFFNGLVALRARKEGSFNVDDLTLSKIAMNAEMQKIDMSMTILNRLIEKRQIMNMKRNQDRNEKILIVAENVQKANFLVLTLKGRNPNLKICALTSFDDLDTAENVNFEFRSEERDICVIDWRSIHDINRGIVDSIIFVDLMDPRVCRTILEDEMERLITRDAVKLKVHVLLDQKKDIWIVPKLAKLLKKYDLKFPSDFDFLVTKYKSWVAELQKN